MEEKYFYDPIGKWLVKNKGCQQDEFSHGYLKIIDVGDILTGVFALRYEVIMNEIPVIDFHGYIVNVIKDERDVYKDIGKLMGAIKRIRSSDEWRYGLHTAKFYIAYPTDRIANDIYSLCMENNIGMLRLQAVDEGGIEVYEVWNPENAFSLIGMAHGDQLNPGNFEKAIEKASYLNKMFKHPIDLYDTYIKPGKIEYRERNVLENTLNQLTNQDAQEARDSIIKKLQSKFPMLGMKAHDKTIRFVDGTNESRNEIISIRHTEDYFILTVSKSYRIYSMDHIIEFDDVGHDYEGGLDNLLDRVIVPHVEEKLNLNMV